MPAFSTQYSKVKFWASVPTYEKQIANMHGDIAVSSEKKCTSACRAVRKPVCRCTTTRETTSATCPMRQPILRVIDSQNRKRRNGHQQTSARQVRPQLYPDPHRVGFNSAGDLFVAESIGFA